MKYNSPCADTAGSAGEGLRKKGGTSMRKRNKVVSLLLAGCMAAGLLAGCGSSGGTQVATADNATAASTSTGAADSAAPETAGEVDGQINLRAVAFGNNCDARIHGIEFADVVLKIGIHQIGAVCQDLQVCLQISSRFDGSL